MARFDDLSGDLPPSPRMVSNPYMPRRPADRRAPSQSVRLFFGFRAIPAFAQRLESRAVSRDMSAARFALDFAQANPREFP